MKPLKNFQIGWSLVVCDELSYAQKPEMREFVIGTDVRRLIETVGDRCVVVLGGDGTMLRAIHAYHADGLPFLGINFGTKGFLLNDRRIIDERQGFVSRSYPLLEVDVRHVDDDVRRAVAFNEVQIKSSSGGMVDIDVSIADRVTQHVQGDGLLVVTPAGSTGYNSSAGGPILPHESGHGIITPLIPWQPRHMRPILYDRKDAVRIANRVDRPRELSIYADSIPNLRDITDPVEVTVRASSHAVRLLIATGYLGEWDAKVFAEQGMMVL